MKKKTLFFGLGAISVVILVIIIIQFGLTNWISNQNEKTLTTINLRIAEQELLLISVADLVRRTEGDEITNRIIVDCPAPDRIRFDTLLDDLSLSISSQDLRELDTLFYKCGSFFADRKAVMSARLYREVEVYDDYVDLRASLISADDVKLRERGAVWLKLANSELVFADNFSTLVRLQGDIITTLLSGERRDSDSITATLVQVKETRDQMVLLSRQIENFRNDLQSL